MTACPKKELYNNLEAVYKIEGAAFPKNAFNVPLRVLAKSTARTAAGSSAAKTL